jgi:hypothetical protein
LNAYLMLDKIEMLLKVALNTHNQNLIPNVLQIHHRHRFH